MRLNHVFCTRCRQSVSGVVRSNPSWMTRVLAWLGLASSPCGLVSCPICGTDRVLRLAPRPRTHRSSEGPVTFETKEWPLGPVHTVVCKLSVSAGKEVTQSGPLMRAVLRSFLDLPGHAIGEFPFATRPDVRLLDQQERSLWENDREYCLTLRQQVESSRDELSRYLNGWRAAALQWKQAVASTFSSLAGGIDVQFEVA